MPETFEFQPDSDGTLSLESCVFQALGAASTCWESLEHAGVFQSYRAKAIGEALLEKIRAVLLQGGVVYKTEGYRFDE